MQYLDLITGKVRTVRKEPKKRKVWYYTYEGENLSAFIQQKHRLDKSGKWWGYYQPFENDPQKYGFSEADSLAGAKGDIEYAGGKVWFEWEKND